MCYTNNNILKNILSKLKEAVQGRYKIVIIVFFFCEVEYGQYNVSILLSWSLFDQPNVLLVKIDIVSIML